MEILTEAGINIVERVPLIVGRNPKNAHYLDTKAAKMGHLLKSDIKSPARVPSSFHQSSILRIT